MSDEKQTEEQRIATEIYDTAVKLNTLMAEAAHHGLHVELEAEKFETRSEFVSRTVARVWVYKRLFP